MYVYATPAQRVMISLADDDDDTRNTRATKIAKRQGKRRKRQREKRQKAMMTMQSVNKRDAEMSIVESVVLVQPECRTQVMQAFI